MRNKDQIGAKNNLSCINDSMYKALINRPKLELHKVSQIRSNILSKNNHI